MLDKIDFWVNFDENSWEVKIPIFKCFNQVSRAKMDSTPSDSIGARKLSKFNNCIMYFQKFQLIFCWIPLKTSGKMGSFRLAFKLYLL